MIEIGRDSRISLAFKRAATTLGGLSMLLGIIWLIRQPVGLEQYSLNLLLISFGLFFLGRLLRTETNSGVGRTLVTILWNLAGICRTHTNDPYLRLDCVSAVRHFSGHDFKMGPRLCNRCDRNGFQRIRTAKIQPREENLDSIPGHRRQRPHHARNKASRQTGHGWHADQT